MKPQDNLRSNEDDFAQPGCNLGPETISVSKVRAFKRSKTVKPQARQQDNLDDLVPPSKMLAKTTLIPPRHSQQFHSEHYLHQEVSREVLQTGEYLFVVTH